MYIDFGASPDGGQDPLRTRRPHTRDAPRAPTAVAWADILSAMADHAHGAPPPPLPPHSYDDTEPRKRHNTRQLPMQRPLPSVTEPSTMSSSTTRATSWQCRPRKYCDADA